MATMRTIRTILINSQSWQNILLCTILSIILSFLIIHNPLIVVVLFLLLCFFSFSLVFFLKFLLHFLDVRLLLVLVLLLTTTFLLNRYEVLVSFKNMEIKFSFLYMVFVIIFSFSFALLRNTTLLTTGIEKFALYFLFLAFLSYLFSPMDVPFVKMLSAVLNFTLPMLIPTAIINLRFSKKQLKLIFLTFIGSAIIYGIISIIVALLSDIIPQLLNWEHGLYIGGHIGDKLIARVITPLGGPNSTASFFILALPLMLGFTKESQGKTKLLFLFGFIILICGLIVTFSRGAIISLLLAVFFFSSSSLKKQALISFTLTTCFIFLVDSLFKIDFSRLVMLTSFEERFSDALRILNLKAGLMAFLKNPLIGSSPGAIYPRFLSKELAEFRETLYVPLLNIKGILSAVEPHNLYLMILVEYGIVGFILAVLLFVKILRVISKEPKDFLSDSCKLSILAHIFYSFFESFLALTIRSAVLFWVIVGLALSYKYALRIKTKL